MNNMKRTRSGFPRRLTLGVSCCSRWCWPPLQTQAQTQTQTGPVVLNFVNADIPSVIKAVGELTGKNSSSIRASRAR